MARKRSMPINAKNSGCSGADIQLCTLGFSFFRGLNSDSEFGGYNSVEIENKSSVVILNTHLSTRQNYLFGSAKAETPKRFSIALASVSA
jgi:hypothetical protein